MLIGKRSCLPAVNQHRRISQTSSDISMKGKKFLHIIKRCAIFPIRQMKLLHQMTPLILIDNENQINRP